MSTVSHSSSMTGDRSFPRSRIVENSTVYEIDVPKPTVFYRRNKINKLDLLYDTPFAMDRQLEDQRLLMEYNKNPQYFAPTKVDKVRSQQIILKKGLSRPIAVKAKVLNKIVREASGVHTYALVPPPMTEEDTLLRSKGGSQFDGESIDPDTNPAMKAYAAQSQSKPVICSFGHRPRSASRLFHPATMKIRMKHGEIVKYDKDSNKFNFGLPVSILATVLKAPKLLRADELLLEKKRENNSLDDPLNLFTLPTSDSQHDNNYSASLVTFAADDNEYDQENYSKALDAEPSWISNLQGSSHQDMSTVSKRNKSKASTMRAKALANLENRPDWNEGFHNIEINSKDKFHAAGVIVNMKDLSIKERLNRFKSLQVAEDQTLPFCVNKQEVDRLVRKGIQVEPKKPTAVIGQQLYFDPLDNQLEEIKRLRKADDEKREAAFREKCYIESLYTIPDCKYFPSNSLKRLMEKTGTEMSGMTRLAAATEEMQESALHRHTKEGLTKAMDKAMSGDKESLMHYFKSNEGTKEFKIKKMSTAA